MPVIAGGVEASLRRLAHYDYWSDKVRRAIILDAKADLIVYGMGERPLVEIVARLAAGQPVARLRDIRGTVYRLGRAKPFRCRMNRGRRRQPPVKSARAESVAPADIVTLPSYEEVAADKRAFAAMTRTIHRETNPRRPAAGAVSRPRGGGGQSAGLAADRGRDGPRLRPAVHAAAAPSYGRQRDSGLRGGEGLDPDCPRLFRRLHVLFADGSPGSHHPEPQPAVGAGGDRPHGRRAAIFPASSATWAVRRPTCTR